MTFNRHQNDDPNISPTPPDYNPIVIDGNIKQSDLRDTLNSQKRAGNVFICSVAEKRELLIGLMKNRSGVAEVLSRIDSQNSLNNTGSTFTTRFQSCFDFHRTDNKIKVASNSSLTDLMLKIYSILREVVDHRFLRLQLKNISPFISKMEEAEIYTASRIEDSAESCKLLKGLPRSKDQLERKILRDGGTIPRDSSLRFCAFCKHPTVDEPPENANVNRNNEIKLANHTVAVEQWHKYKDGKGPCPKNRNGKDMTRIPPTPKLDSLILQCHCHQMSCARQNSDMGSTCSILCAKMMGHGFLERIHTVHVLYVRVVAKKHIGWMTMLK